MTTISFFRNILAKINKGNIEVHLSGYDFNHIAGHKQISLKK